MNKKKIVFLSGTRADFGKIKSLIKILENSEFESYIFVTGMHMLSKYGYTINEIYKSKFKNIFPFINCGDGMDIILSNTINGFSKYIKEIKPDMIVVHGDRVEAVAGAMVGALNNILVAHIEGGEISGTIDELIRHSVSKISHIHLVSNEEAKNRLIQMGEKNSSIFNIGSPDIDLMSSPNLPSIKLAKEYYGISFEKYAIALFHPVTTELKILPKQVKIFCNSLIKSDLNYIVIYPNNDVGSDIILNEYDRFKNNAKFKIFPSIRFEYFLTLLKNSQFIIGNSSAGIREAPYYKIPTINLGTRQNNRSKDIKNIDFKEEEIIKTINIALQEDSAEYCVDFGNGNSAIKFLEILRNSKVWNTPLQKIFVDIV
ncbi:UDP-N-acetylglucosamine 2-epimerase [Campylobacter blaseri]|uniref:UDP-N-acetylglucosamine 2-epimerase (Hydrolyzing) n=1 Tax=Campylobacter blaseri TaxID=2042961 RepID=A0A2P8QZ87_9BACT|nr:UDP-N-acetylglucosamine 2-epimerase [Campylobacter blaseri]PSM51559.1 UDP-N-acetylglucosamine 2-epimerase (hydrolyzing) [Campylobacter blaseri]PSM53352.1 UDP-N-acetylglucosamine 2-epimerase (hydrolyzing) [Campylobacter blaseri]QKF86646.1 UDP-N-acetylglucosamine 2-epimerase [Campylobacter blaseri]